MIESLLLFAIVKQNQTPFTRAEAKYALDTLFAWQGFKAVRSGDGTVQLQKIEAK